MATRIPTLIEADLAYLTESGKVTKTVAIVVLTTGIVFVIVGIACTILGGLRIHYSWPSEPIWFVITAVTILPGIFVIAGSLGTLTHDMNPNYIDQHTFNLIKPPDNPPSGFSGHDI